MYNITADIHVMEPFGHSLYNKLESKVYIIHIRGGGRFLDFLDFQPVATGSICKILF
jgi:hypothetical protein